METCFVPLTERALGRCKSLLCKFLRISGTFLTKISCHTSKIKYFSFCQLELSALFKLVDKTYDQKTCT